MSIIKGRVSAQESQIRLLISLLTSQQRLHDGREVFHRATFRSLRDQLDVVDREHASTRNAVVDMQYALPPHQPEQVLAETSDDQVLPDAAVPIFEDASAT